MSTNTLSLNFPESGLTINIDIINQNTLATDFTGVATEVLNTKNYIYSFNGVNGVNYTYVATGYGDGLSGAIIYEASGGGGGSGASVADIWTAQITDYSSTLGSFANKFANYGGVSHIIQDNNGKSGGGELSKEDKKLLTDIKDSNETIKKDLVALNNKPLGERVVTIPTIEKVFIPTVDTGLIMDVVAEGLLEISDSMIEVVNEGLLEIKNNK